ncbi:metallophosphoesterase [Pseudomonas aeruginosa]
MAKFYCDPIKEITYSGEGKIFVVGDIHGAYDLLKEAMRAARFDQNKDLLLVVGDLLDRGPDSWRVANFLKMPYVHAVRGNHEDFLIEMYAGEVEPPEEVIEMFDRRWPQNGLKWWLSVKHEQRLEIINSIRQLPVILEVKTPRGSFGVVHADVPSGMSWQDFKKAIAANDENTLAYALEGRRRLARGDDTPVPGIGRIFVGHTVQGEGMSKLGNIYYLDTGAVFAELDKTIREGEPRLTMVNAMMQTQLLRQPPVKEGKLDVRDGHVPSTPFSGV